MIARSLHLTAQIFTTNRPNDDFTFVSDREMDSYRREGFVVDRETCGLYRKPGLDIFIEVWEMAEGWLVREFRAY